MISSSLKYSLIIILAIMAFSCKTPVKDDSESGEFKKTSGYLPKKDYFSSIPSKSTEIGRAAKLIKGRYFTKAHEILNQLLKKRKNVNGAYYLKGYICMLEKRYDMARFMFDKLRGKGSYEVAVHNNLGVIHLFEEDLETAVYHFEKALKLDPYYLPALVNRSRISLRFGLFAKAYEDLSRAISSNEDDGDILLLYAISLRGLKKYTEAKEILTKLVGTREGLYNLGLLYYEDLQDWENAKKTFEKYLRSGPSFGEEDMAETYLSRARGKVSK